MKSSWHTAWQGMDIAVYRNDAEVDRLHAPDIERVVLVHHGSGDSPGDLVQAVVEVGDSYLIFPADTGFAGRVNFERQAFWAERACVYWVNEARAPLPHRLRRGRWFLGLSHPVYRRVPRAELAALIERWPLQGPQTWEQRKWRRIERNRPFAREEDTRLRA
ncbi:MAG: hypothetical protein KGL99_04405 [Burkholderiales bacterium]|nr:hypothetical protein [Burkholderiales bacterium]MDE2626374.1 hypothetical protein [Burkholderiales bacterium]